MPIYKNTALQLNVIEQNCKISLPCQHGKLNLIRRHFQSTYQAFPQKPKDKNSLSYI